MSTEITINKTEKENLLNKNDGNNMYGVESESKDNDNIGGLLGDDGIFSSVDSVKTIIVILFIVFECIPIILGGYILNTNYSLYFVLIFGISLFGIICVAKEKFHYVLIMIFMYTMYIFILFIIAFDAFKESNSDKYHIQKIKSVSTLWIIMQFVIAAIVYYKCCKSD